VLQSFDSNFIFHSVCLWVVLRFASSHSNLSTPLIWIWRYFNTLLRLSHTFNNFVFLTGLGARSPVPLLKSIGLHNGTCYSSRPLSEGVSTFNEPALSPKYGNLGVFALRILGPMSKLYHHPYIYTEPKVLQTSLSRAMN